MKDLSLFIIRVISTIALLFFGILIKITLDTRSSMREETPISLLRVITEFTESGEIYRDGDLLFLVDLDTCGGDYPYGVSTRMFGNPVYIHTTNYKKCEEVKRWRINP